MPLASKLYQRWTSKPRAQLVRTIMMGALGPCLDLAIVKLHHLDNFAEDKGAE
jgi:hypothetical protein